MNGGSAYEQACELSKRGPTVILNLPEHLQVYCTPLEKVAPDIRHEPLSADVQQRIRFILTYAVTLGQQHARDSRGRA